MEGISNATAAAALTQKRRPAAAQCDTPHDERGHPVPPPPLLLPRPATVASAPIATSEPAPAPEPPPTLPTMAEFYGAVPSSLPHPQLAEVLRNCERDGLQMRAGSEQLAAYGAYAAALNGHTQLWICDKDIMLVHVDAALDQHLGSELDACRHQLNGDTARRARELLRDAVDTESFTDRLIVLDNLRLQRSGLHGEKEIPIDFKKACANYQYLVAQRQPGESLMQVAEAWVNLGTVVGVWTDAHKQHFEYVRKHFDDTDSVERYRRVIHHTSGFMSADAIQSILDTDISGESRADRVQALEAATVYATDELTRDEDRWNLGNAALEHYQEALRSATPAEKFSELTADYQAAVQGAHQGWRDGDDALRQFHALRECGSDKAWIRELVKSGATVESARAARQWLATQPAAATDLFTRLALPMGNCEQARSLYEALGGKPAAVALAADLAAQLRNGRSSQHRLSAENLGAACRFLSGRGMDAEASRQFRALLGCSHTAEEANQAWKLLKPEQPNSTREERVQAFVTLAEAVGPGWRAPKVWQLVEKHRLAGESLPTAAADAADLFRALARISSGHDFDEMYVKMKQRQSTNTDELRLLKRCLGVGLAWQASGIRESLDAPVSDWTLPQRETVFFGLCRVHGQGDCDNIPYMAAQNAGMSYHMLASHAIAGESAPQALERYARLNQAVSDLPMQEKCLALVAEPVAGTNADQRQEILLQLMTARPQHREEALADFRVLRDDPDGLEAAATRMQQLAASTPHAEEARKAYRFVRECVSLRRFPDESADSITDRACAALRQAQHFDLARTLLVEEKPHCTDTVERDQDSVKIGTLRLPRRQ